MMRSGAVRLFFMVTSLAAESVSAAAAAKGSYLDSQVYRRLVVF